MSRINAAYREVTKNISVLEEEMARLEKADEQIATAKKNKKAILLTEDTMLQYWVDRDIDYTKSAPYVTGNVFSTYVIDPSNEQDRAKLTAISKYGNVRVSQINGESVIEKYLVGDELTDYLVSEKLIEYNHSNPLFLTSSHSAESYPVQQKTDSTSTGKKITIQCSSSDSNSTLNVFPKNKKSFINVIENKLTEEQCFHVLKNYEKIKWAFDKERSRFGDDVGYTPRNFELSMTKEQAILLLHHLTANYKITGAILFEKEQVILFQFLLCNGHHYNCCILYGEKLVINFILSCIWIWMMVFLFMGILLL